MEHLLEQISHHKLLKGAYFNEVVKARELLSDCVEEQLKLRCTTPSWVAATAYVLGVRQGIHQERARRKAHIKKPLSQKEGGSM